MRAPLLSVFSLLRSFRTGRGHRRPVVSSVVSSLMRPVNRNVTLSPQTCDRKNDDLGGQIPYLCVMFGIDIIDASLFPAMLVALVAGLLSFLSPCVLPIVPPYLAYMSGTTIADLRAAEAGRNKAIVPALFFVLGLSTIFLILGFAASVAGAALLQYQSY